MNSMTDRLFKPIDIICPKCSNRNLETLNLMMICTDCGYYHIKHNDKVGNIKLKRIGGFIIGQTHEKPLGKQYFKAKEKLFK
jgi:uncharacterized Zn finger protein